MQVSTLLLLVILIYESYGQIIQNGLLSPNDATFQDPNQWSCGSDPTNSVWAGRAIAYACEPALTNVNNCCRSHDDCYRQQTGRAACDDTFCNCMKTSMSVCKSLKSLLIMNAFCDIVRTQGGLSYIQG
ncbi:unnamed protein product [Bursaphelenchus okinawaensis]|uniref:Phospholipase A(2) n=1 Tax=Bursaphelenchus okinawaensis TaxID=465554 RepID=A0A811L9T3_9BILA|nr:unnamed protein product [Bursaphelenchus okinawaensis]CAG9121720.1 unnamed protein product [Bursaphelenchus okinawaensis]